MGRIRIRQKQCLWRWLVDARKTYNMAMADVLQRKLHRGNAQGFNAGKLKRALQAKFVTASGVMKLSQSHHYLLRTPKAIRQQAVFRVVSVLATHYTKLANRTKLAKAYPHAIRFKKKLRFNPGFKSRKLLSGETDSIEIEAVSLRILTPTTVSLFTQTCWRPTSHLHRHYTPMVTVALKDQQKQWLVRGRKRRKAHPDSPELECRLGGELTLRRPLAPGITGDRDFKVHFSANKVELLLPQVVHPSIDRPNAPLSSPSIVAIDVGVRKFITTYSNPAGVVEMLGTNTYKVIGKCLKRIRKAGIRTNTALKRLLETKLRRRRGGGSNEVRKDLAHKRHRVWKFKRKEGRARQKMRNVVKNFHYRCAHHLLRQHSHIILPHTSSHHWRKSKTMSQTLKRTIMALSYGMFGTRLAQTATFYPGRRIYRGSEAYTSKQCFKCGHLNNKSSSETFVCKRCAFTCDRDAHGAANILLRFCKCDEESCGRCSKPGRETREAPVRKSKKCKLS